MFRTELTIAPAAGQLARTALVLTMGSCFADSIGSRLVANKVEARVNPFGTVFQPLALARLLRAAAGEEVDWQRHLVQARGRWQSYDLHGSVGADSPVELLQYIQEVVRQTGEFLRNTDVVLLTLGTAWAYRLRETGELVSNCHKQPSDLFVRELLTPDEIINALAETHAYLRRINPDLRFVLTVSPVRHLKDTLQLNAVSKSVLRLATHIVSDLLPGVAYFPAYELLVDDLRDYRFYASDMLHPSEVAEDYIWEKFARAYFDADFGRFRKEWAAVRQSLGHRPLHEGAPEHRQFLESTREKLEQLSLRKVDVADELRTVRARIAALPEPIQPPMVVEELEDNEERIDIGEGSEALPMTPVAPANGAAAEQPTSSTETGRASRLSPEEFRAHRAGRSDRPERGRRDGRGRGRGAAPSETEAFQAASFGEADEFAQQPFLANTDVGETELTPVAASTEFTVGAVNSEQGADAAEHEQGRKKKRRSRGGAKRTARKHALRLTAELGIDPSQLPASETALEAAAGALPAGQNIRPETPKSSVITKSQPVKRGGRRNEPGRVPRVELFATPPAAEGSASETPMVDAEAFTPVDFEALTTPDALIINAESDSDIAATTSRSSRNRKKKKARKLAASVDEASTATSENVVAGTHQTLPIASAAQLSESSESVSESRREDMRQPQEPVAALPVSGQATAVVSTTGVPNAVDTPVTNPAPAKPSARKRRAAVGGRAEKPAVDTPVIPIADPSVVRTQVAAGRMMGTSASLVTSAPEPKADATKTVPSKAAVVRKATAKAKPANAPVAPTAAMSAAPVATEASSTATPPTPKRKVAAKAKAAAAPALSEAQAPDVTTETAPTAADKPVPAKKKVKSAQKPAAAAEQKVAAVAKAAAKKSVSKAAITKAAAQKKAVTKADKPVIATETPAAKPAAKRKTPKKSA
ncbi:GSCFA domain-containing protein [Hymenobacter negativus]|uniref:GSCFA domain-containing protein n=1 Tax=Hymenobacter negativus TaxID=2795026 RepID=A0ABS0Q6R1_9BACT|nr:GSCFA domain-containing protein [Hymenobacter negativus]MBH8558350.1 GSCFA domain-containing protein [Hymenobacter negativus]